MTRRKSNPYLELSEKDAMIVWYLLSSSFLRLLVVDRDCQYKILNQAQTGSQRTMHNIGHLKRVDDLSAVFRNYQTWEKNE